MSEPLQLPVSSIWAGLEEFVGHPRGCSCRECAFLAQYVDEWDERVKPFIQSIRDSETKIDPTIVINTRA